MRAPINYLFVGRLLRTIHGKIFTRFLAVITVFFVIVALAASYLTAQMTHEFAIRDSENSLKFLVSNIHSSYFSHLKALDELANNPTFKKADFVNARKTVQTFLEFSTIFSTAHLYRPNGDLVFAEFKPDVYPYQPEPSFYQKSDRFVRLAKEVIKTGKAQATPTFYTKSNFLYQLYLVPIKDGLGKVIGLLSGGVFPRIYNLNHLLDGLALARHNFIYISDDHGSTLAASGMLPQRIPEIGIYEVPECGQSNASSPINSDAFTALLANWNGEPYIQLQQEIPDLKLKVTMGINRDLVEAKVSELLKSLFLAFIVCFLFALVFSLYIGQRVSRPLQEVLDSVREIDRGNFDVGLSAEAADEFGELARYIDRIRRKIQKDRLLGEFWGEELKL